MTVILSHGPMAVMAVVGILALILAMRIGRLIARLLLLGLIALAAIGGAIGWFLLRS